MKNTYDLIIIGAGPAGLSAGLYAGRARLKTVIVERGQTGGQIATTSEIENYPGGLSEPGKPESGQELTDRMARQAEGFGIERLYANVTAVDLEGPVKRVHTRDVTLEAPAVIIATGTHPRLLGVPGEKEFTGRGVSYCATCDGAFFRDLEVFVVGGGNAAVEEALFLTRFARRVTIIHRRNELRADKAIQERAFKNEKIHIMWNSVVTELSGEHVLSSITVRDTKTGEERIIKADEKDGIFGVFMFVGLNPNTELFKDKIATENGYVLTDDEMRTNIPGVYAAGDIRKKSLRQVVTACSDGAIAAVQAERDLAAGLIG